MFVVMAIVLVMGTDFLSLFDRHAAEIIMGANETELATLVDLKTTLDGPLVWREYLNDSKDGLLPFDKFMTSAERLVRMLRDCRLDEIKRDLILHLCSSCAFLHVDYWGCWAEVFTNGASETIVTWESFAAPIDPKTEMDVSSSCYLLTNDNVQAILDSLEAHRSDVTIMSDAEIDRLRSWRAFCLKHPEFCVLYHIDC